VTDGEGEKKIKKNLEVMAASGKRKKFKKP